ncbi:pyocin knob domain-containing protein [Cohnella rhizosphaerae]|uniref:Pyocin knob domain-containing protein n=1 Tax=Cohnella rhizosphaerae TaxID=1457232 RepID=A0A9X4KWX9_9BACL|nr:pyocin knob domain-containing protein [Cohnella rhizosphaerae]
MYGGGDTVAQFGVSYSNNDVYVRSGNPSDVGGTGTWGIWRKVWNEGNDGTGERLGRRHGGRVPSGSRRAVNSRPDLFPCSCG